MRRLLLIAALMLLGSCATRTQLLTLASLSKTAALGRPLISEKCDEVIESCIKTKDATCEKQKECDAAERKVYAGVGTLQLLADAAGAAIKAGDKERTQELMAEVVRRLELIRDILKNWGLKL